MEEVRTGSVDAFARLLERHWSELVQYATGIIGRPDDAQDVTQECFIRVWRKRASWRLDGSVAGYLFRITRNLALNAKRDLGTLRSGEAQFRNQTLKKAGPPDPLEELEANRLNARVQAAIQALPVRRREVFVLARYHGLSYQEIADVMGISTQTVANQMSSAIGDLRATLKLNLPCS